MNKDRTSSIPLLSFSLPLTVRPWEKNGADEEPFPMIRVEGHELAEGCYGVKIEDESMAPVLRPGMLAVFSPNGNKVPALKDIFSIGQKGGLPVVRKVIRNEMRCDAKTGFDSAKGRVRKSFMTPTPLHISESRVSPIADSTHQMIYFKRLAQPEDLTLLPARNLLWMHPLVMILPVGKI